MCLLELQARIRLLQADSTVELCLAPAPQGSLEVAQTAHYSPRLAPGSVTWQLKKTVQLPPAFQDGVVHMMQGDVVVSLQQSQQQLAGVVQLPLSGSLPHKGGGSATTYSNSSKEHTKIPIV